MEQHLVLDACRARLQSMRMRAAHLLREVHHNVGAVPGDRGASVRCQLVLSLRRTTRWAELKLVRMTFAPEWSVVAEEFEVVMSALDRHCLDLEGWLRRQAG